MVTQKKKTYTPEDIVVYNMGIGKDIDTYTKISLIRSACGVVSIGIGIGTWFIPMTTVPLISLGCWLLGYDSKALGRKARYKIGLFFDWIYCNRSPKRILKTLNRSLL